MRAVWMKLENLTPANIVQQRAAGISKEVVEDYAEALDRGDKFPPIDVFRQGETYRIADGFHRYEAHEKAGLEKIRCYIHDGGESKAIIFACGANRTNGLRRTNKDKRKCVETLLRVVKRASNRKIAAMAGVTPQFVDKIVNEQADSGVPTIGTQPSGGNHNGTLAVEQVEEDDVEVYEGVDDDDEDVEERDLDGEAMRVAKKCDALAKMLRELDDDLRGHKAVSAAFTRLRKSMRNAE